MATPVVVDSLLDIGDQVLKQRKPPEDFFSNPFRSCNRLAAAQVEVHCVNY